MKLKCLLCNATIDTKIMNLQNKTVTEICTMQPELKIVHGKPRYSQSQGLVKQANQDIKIIFAQCCSEDRG